MTTLNAPRDHGGNLDAAIAKFGGARSEWLDLSTGINPEPYPVPNIPVEAWSVLPRKSDMDRLKHAAALSYRANCTVVPFAGAQGAIQAMPWLCKQGHARVLTPTYNEHAGALRSGGWTVQECSTIDGLAGADLAVVVNPNNPDGLSYQPADLIHLAGRVGVLLVDESFCDPTPYLSIANAAQVWPENLIVLRSFGKFYGLAGVRLGFALASETLGYKLAELAGPWPVSGPAIEIAVHALSDQAWFNETCDRLDIDAQRLDALALGAACTLVGGTTLFRTFATSDASALQNHLAQYHVWTRVFPYSSNWIRIGLPPKMRWNQLEVALKNWVG